MTYYEFRVQIYTKSDETAKSVFETVRAFMDDKKIKYGTSVLWEMRRRVIS